MSPPRAKIIGISRHRLSTDGEGVTTLVVFHACPLRCRYCLNPQTISADSEFKEYTPLSLYEEVKIDALYFMATGGGITFGGGEPALHSDFIVAFRELSGQSWRITIESSLNVSQERIKELLPVVDSWIIDIKDMDTERYRRYTSCDNSLVLSNLRLIAQSGLQGNCLIRIPLIPDYNTPGNREDSRSMLVSLGFSQFDLFTYIIHPTDYGTRKTYL